MEYLFYSIFKRYFQMLGTNCEVKSISRYALFNAWRLGGIATTVILITLIFAFVLHRWISRKQHDPEELDDTKLNSYLEQNFTS